MPECNIVEAMECSSREEEECDVVEEQECKTVGQRQCSEVLEQECSDVTDRVCNTIQVLHFISIFFLKILSSDSVVGHLSVSVTIMTTYLFSIVLCFKPYKPYIFQKHMTAGPAVPVSTDGLRIIFV